MGCPGWSDTLNQEGFEMLHQGVPAQMLEVQIEEMLDDSNVKLEMLSEYFSPIIHTVNLLNTETEDNIVGEEKQERKEK